MADVLQVDKLLGYDVVHELARLVCGLASDPGTVNVLFTIDPVGGGLPNIGPAVLSVPEPGTLALLAGGLMGLGFSRRKTA